MKRFLLLPLLFISLFLQAQNREFSPTEKALNKLIRHEAMKHGSVAFMAVNLDNGTILADHNLYKSMVPASIQKLVTTSAALSILTPSHTFKTTLGYTGAIEEGKLVGDLFVVGGGDPTLESRYFSDATLDPFWNFLVEHNIKQVGGDLNLNTSLFSAHTTPRGWIWEDLGNYFGATPSSITWRDNLMEVSLKSGAPGERATIQSIEPSPNGLKMDIEVEAADSKRDNAWFYGPSGTDAMYARGSIPKDRDKFVVKASNPQVSQTFGAHFLRMSRLVNTQVSTSTDPVQHDFAQSVDITSPPLYNIVKVCNHRSVNLFAESLLIHLDSESHGKTTEGGIKQLSDWMKKSKMRLQGTRILDGSGLSPLNRMTAQCMIDVLTEAYRSDYFDDFYHSIPLAGRSGTIANSFKAEPLEGNLRAKSGTMTGVRNYAGYVKNAKGETIAFCVMLNDYDETQRTAVMELVENLMATAAQ